MFAKVMQRFCVTAVVALLYGVEPSHGAETAPVRDEAIRRVADHEVEYALASMERLKGKAILLPEVVVLVGARCVMPRRPTTRRSWSVLRRFTRLPISMMARSTGSRRGISNRRQLRSCRWSCFG